MSHNVFLSLFCYQKKKMFQRSENIIIPLLLLLFFSVSCGVNNRKQAEEIIREFEQNNIPDKRETVFNIEPEFFKGNIVLKGETSDPGLKEELLAELESFQPRDEIIELPDSTVGDHPYALVTLSVANLRSAPRHSSELVTQALLGTPLQILKIRDGWLLVQTPEHYISWVDAAGITPVTNNELEQWRQAEKVIFTENLTHIYETEQMEKPVSDITMGGIAKVLEQSWNRLEVQLPDGRSGFADPQGWTGFSEFLENARPDSTSLAGLAETFTGRPYLWGGTSSLAMDCSGFTKMIFFMHGIILPRDASQQARQGRLINTGSSFSQLQPGDLLFYGQKENNEQPEKITHVALSLGKTEYIHAAGRVQQNSFNPASELFSEYREESFIRAKRITEAEEIQWVKEHPWY